MVPTRGVKQKGVIGVLLGRSNGVKGIRVRQRARQINRGQRVSEAGIEGMRREWG